jgi:hypothetical protein
VPSGLNGTSHSFPQSAQVALCISFGYDILLISTPIYHYVQISVLHSRTIQLPSFKPIRLSVKFSMGLVVGKGLFLVNLDIAWRVCGRDCEGDAGVFCLVSFFLFCVNNPFYSVKTNLERTGEDR